MIHFELKHPRADREMLGLLPAFWSELDPEPAAAQAHRMYSHGGGWSPMPGWRMSESGDKITYPGDPSCRLIAEAKLRQETIRLYEHAWVAIVQPDGSYEVSRMD